jgi:parallel beta-helix repeat protein
MAFFLGDSDDILVTNNKITRMENGVYFTRSTGCYMGNLVRGATTPFTGGTDAGGNYP